MISGSLTTEQAKWAHPPHRQYRKNEDMMTPFLQALLAPLSAVELKFYIIVLCVNFPGCLLTSGNWPNVQNTKSGKCHNIAFLGL